MWINEPPRTRIRKIDNDHDGEADNPRAIGLPRARWARDVAPCEIRVPRSASDRELPGERFSAINLRLCAIITTVDRSIGRH